MNTGVPEKIRKLKSVLIYADHFLRHILSQDALFHVCFFLVILLPPETRRSDADAERVEGCHNGDTWGKNGTPQCGIILGCLMPHLKCECT